ncbi:hypothetical protein C8Q80DRAFT_1122664 [Daedaleopsis nitida]|nr:hypothetical protein C8Q80DRAFT_1122664 [Daedaleopsis nitida]
MTIKYEYVADSDSDIEGWEDFYDEDTIVLPNRARRPPSPSSACSEVEEEEMAEDVQESDSSDEEMEEDGQQQSDEEMVEDVQEGSDPDASNDESSSSDSDSSSSPSGSSGSESDSESESSRSTPSHAPIPASAPTTLAHPADEPIIGLSHPAQASPHMATLVPLPTNTDILIPSQRTTRVPKHQMSDSESASASDGQEQRVRLRPLRKRARRRATVPQPILDVEASSDKEDSGSDYEASMKKTNRKGKGRATAPRSRARRTTRSNVRAVPSTSMQHSQEQEDAPSDCGEPKVTIRIVPRATVPPPRARLRRAAARADPEPSIHDSEEDDAYSEYEEPKDKKRGQGRAAAASGARRTRAKPPQPEPEPAMAVDESPEEDLVQGSDFEETQKKKKKQKKKKRAVNKGKEPAQASRRECREEEKPKRIPDEKALILRSGNPIECPMTAECKEVLDPKTLAIQNGGRDHLRVHINPRYVSVPKKKAPNEDAEGCKETENKENKAEGVEKSDKVSNPVDMKATIYLCTIAGCECPTVFRMNELVRHIESTHLPWKYWCPSPGCVQEYTRLDALTCNHIQKQMTSKKQKIADQKVKDAKKSTNAVKTSNEIENACKNAQALAHITLEELRDLLDVSTSPDDLKLRVRKFEADKIVALAKAGEIEESVSTVLVKELAAKDQEGQEDAYDGDA